MLKNIKKILLFLLLSSNLLETDSLLNNIVNRRQIITTAASMSAISNNNINNINNRNNNNKDKDNDNDNDNDNDIQDSNYNSNFIGALTKESRQNLYFYSELNDQSAFQLASNLIFLMNNLPHSESINLHIQSHGGSLLPTLSVVDLIRTSDIPIYTHIEGYAASAATLLSVVGQKRFITKNSVMLIHQLKMRTDGPKYSDILDSSVNAETLMNLLKNIYLENTNLDSYTLDYLLSKDLWLNSTTCQKYGLVDIVK